MATKIKLTCATCSGQVTYSYEKPADQDAAHSRLHSESCEFKKSGKSLSYIAEHGLPVESEVLS